MTQEIDYDINDYLFSEKYNAVVHMRKTANHRKKIVIVNDGLGPNKGDQAILLSMLESLKNTFPDVQVEVFPNSEMQKPNQYLKFWAALKGADLFIFGGGQEIQDHASLAFLISGLLKIILAKILSVPIYCYAVGVGPVRTRLGIFLTRIVLNKVNLITTRDEPSRQYLYHLGVTIPLCIVAADPALALTPASASRAQEILNKEGIKTQSGPRIAIAPRHWFHYSHYWLPMKIRVKLFPLRGQKEFKRLMTIIAQIADFMMDQEKAHIIFVPMRPAGNKIDPGQDDDFVSEKIMQDMIHQSIRISGDYTPQELQALLGTMDLVIGMRMHSLIMGCMMGVPVIGLNIAPKFSSFFQYIEMEEFLINVSDITVDIMLDRIRAALRRKEQIQQELRVKTEAMKMDALSNIAFIKKLLQ